MYILDHPILGKKKEDKISLYYDDKEIEALKGQSVAAALLSNGITQFGVSENLNEPRGYYCGTGRCYQCCLTINDQQHVRSCMTKVEPNMNVKFNTGKVSILGSENSEL